MIEPSEGGMRSQPKRSKPAKLIFLGLSLVVALPLAAKQKKAAGEIKDRAAFADIKSYCVDLSGLEDYESYDVHGFVEQESRPGKLLSRIPWKLEADCREAEPDAVVKLEFPRSRVVGPGSGPPPIPGTTGQPPPVTVGGTEPAYHTSAVLRVVSRQTSRTIYECRADPLSPQGSDSGPVAAADTVQRHNAMYGAFWTLAQDIKRVSP